MIRQRKIDQLQVTDELRLERDARIRMGDLGTGGWRDMVGKIVGRGTGAADPTWSAFINGIYAYSFSATVMKEVWVEYHIDHDYAMNTPIYIHAHWSTTGTNAGVVRWGFEVTAAKGHQQQVFPATQTIYVNQAATGVARTHMIAEVQIPDALTANFEPDTLVMARVFRDAADGADTCSDAAFLLVADCHYQMGQLATPQKSPHFWR